MKSKYISFVTLLAAVAVMAAQPADAQTSTPGYSPDGVELFKNVVEGSAPNTYTINLEAFVTGESITQEVVTSAPCDFLLILDYSSSMTNSYEGSGPFTYPFRTVYTYNDVTSNTKYTFNGAQYQVKTQRSNDGKYLNQNRCNWAYIEVGSKRYYLTLDGSVIEAASNGNMDGAMDNPVNWPKGVNGEIIYPASGTGRPLYAEITMKTTTQKTRQFALLDAVSNFIDIVNADAKENNVDHRIGIVDFQNDSYPRFEAPNSSDALKYTTSSWYNYLRPVEGINSNYTTLSVAKNSSNLTSPYGSDYNTTAVLKHFTSVNDQTATGIKGCLAQMNVAGSTATDRGISLGKILFDAEKRSDENVGKVVIVFSDGNPENQGGQNENYKKQCSNNAIVAAKTLKDAGYKVYSIGVLGNNPQDYNLQTLNAISSNYPNATQYSHASTTDTGDGYFKNVTGGDLSDVFASIASSEMTGGAGYKLEKTTTTVIDVVSPAFKLPDGADGSKITLQVAKCKGVQSTETDGSYVFTFYDPLTKEATKALFPEIDAKVGVLEKTKVGDKTVVNFVEKEGGKAVSITGFGFSDNWVGPRTEGGVTSYDGYKLIISFPIEIDPSNPGGATESTNTEDSGIYTRENPDAPWEQIGGFEIPKVKIPNIIVIKNGLKKGDSAIFNVYKVEKDGTKSQFPIQLVATCKEDGKPAIAKTKIQKTGRYMVEETTWSWAYGISECQKDYPGYEDSSSITDKQWHEKGFGKEDETGYPATIPFKFGTEVTANSITRNVNDFTEQEEKGVYKGTLFIFSNEAKTGTPAHAEANVNNVFYECN